MPSTAAAAIPSGPSSSSSAALIGRTFLHPAIDYALIGGGLTIPIFIAVLTNPPEGPRPSPIWLFLLINGAHFAASTVRLYTKPGAKEGLPFLSWGFPIVCLAAVWAGLEWPKAGQHLTALYLTWSPYHYAAQAYGLAVMYAMRSGARLDERDKRLMRMACLLPFVYAFLTSTTGGISWFADREVLMAAPVIGAVYSSLLVLVTIGVVALPLVLFFQLHQLKRKQVPLIVPLLQVTNGMWWLASGYEYAFWWAAAAHSVQYLLIAMLDYTRTMLARPNAGLGSLHHPLFHGTWFYAVSFALAGLLFFVIPVLTYVPLGYDAAASVWMMAVIINLHHFIVDGFIWKSGKARGQSAPSGAAAPA